jgi:putative nucleotidyltransferase with HDIG domain
VLFRDTSATEVIKTGRLQYVSNLKNIKNLPPLEDRLLKNGFLSHIRIPIVAKNEIVGVLNLGSQRQSAFSPEDLSTLEKLAYQIGVALENSRLITDLEELFLGTVKSLSSAIDAKSKWTAGHSERVTRYALSMGKEMSFSENELKDLELGGLLHDIGKLGTYEAILDKPGRLTDEEFKLVKQHPMKGAEILSPIKQLRNIIPAVRNHHEFYNGKGYPDGLKEDEIPLMARIMCIADSVDAMGADRPYRKGKSMDEIVTELKRCSWTQFDPKVVDVFLKVAKKIK